MAGTPEQNRSALLSKQLGKLTQQTNAILHSLLVVIYYVQLGSRNVTVTRRVGSVLSVL